MRNKITFQIEGETFSRICSITKNVDHRLITFIETPGVNMEMKIYLEKLIIKKCGLINIDINHIVGKKNKTNYKININGNIFEGCSIIKTKKYITTDDCVYLEFFRDGDLVIQKWEIKWTI
ncbi:MAG: hypothetical protein ACRC5R_04080 [Mycoplasmatales bacterium]